MVDWEITLDFVHTVSGAHRVYIGHGGAHRETRRGVGGEILEDNLQFDPDTMSSISLVLLFPMFGE